MKLRALLTCLGLLAGLPVAALATTTATAAPATAQPFPPGQGGRPVTDVRGGAYPAGDPTGAGSIKPGDAETFNVTAYGYNVATESYGQVSFGRLAKLWGQREIHFRLYYGWGQAGVVTERGCTGIGHGDTYLCYHQSSPGYTSSSTAMAWKPTTDVAAPSKDLTTLFDAVWLIPGPPGDRAQPLIESRADNIVYGTAATPKRIFLSSTWGTGPQEVPAGTKVSLTACITDKNCQSGLVSSGNFLGDYLYVCDTWPPFKQGGVPATKGLPPNGQLYTSGKADQVFGGIEQSFNPPPGQDWSLFYEAFASSHANLAAGTNPICPTSPQEVNAGTATGMTSDYATLMVTWKGRAVVPPQVSLTVQKQPPTNGTANGPAVASLQAIASNTDGNQSLFICARSGTKWLTLSSPAVHGYLAASSTVVNGVMRAEGTATDQSGTGGTARFIAFLSTQPTVPSSCPAPGSVSAAAGTLKPLGWYSAQPWQSPWDYSNVVNVTWPAVPSPSHPKVALVVSSAISDANQPVTLTATYLHPDGNSHLYVCARSGTKWLRLSGRSPYVASAPVPSAGLAQGAAAGRQPGTAQFVAFLSTRGSLATSGQCPATNAPSSQWGTERPPGWPANKPWDGAWDFSTTTVNVTWALAKQSPPSVSLSASTTSASFGSSVTFIAQPSNPGAANAIYICAPGSQPWLATDIGGSWVAEQQLPISGPELGYTTGSPGATGGTAQFVAFLSSRSSPPAQCPLTDAVGSAYGTTTTRDYSGRVVVHWAGPPANRADITLSASPSAPVAGQRSALVATYSHPGQAVAVYICMTSGPAGVTLSGPKPYVAANGVRPGAGTGKTSGWAKAPGSSATFVAYLSTEVGRQGSGKCPTSPGADGATAVSTPVTVTWGSTPLLIPGLGPIVNLSVNADQVPNGTPVTLTAWYVNPGEDKALYIVDELQLPPSMTYPYGLLYQTATQGQPSLAAAYTGPGARPAPYAADQTAFGPVKHMPYVAAHPVPTYPDAGATLSGDNETVQFAAFLSSLDGLQAGQTFLSGQQTAVDSPGPGVVSSLFGTTTPADFSPMLTVTWGDPSSTTITLSASPAQSTGCTSSGAGGLTCKPDQKVFFTATATNMPPGDYLYLCDKTSPGGAPKTSSGSNYLAAPTQSSVISGWASGNGTSAAFYAFDSPEPPPYQWGTLAGGGGCFTAPYNWPPPPGAGDWYVPTVSNEISVAWLGGRKKIYWFSS